MRFCTRVADYFATGEGQTLSIVIAPTPAAAERVFKREFGEWLNSGAENFDGRPDRYARWIPEPVFSLAEDTPNFVYYSEWHFNLS